MSFFSSFHPAKQTPQWLIVGLGNPGREYEKTRHNAGFLALDTLAAAENISVNRLKYHALTGSGQIAGVPCFLMKPQTYMNHSGASVAEAARFFKIPSAHILVFFDDITLSPGDLRIRRNGSHGGHNGAKDIVRLLGDDGFPRVRLGIGAKPHPDYDLADWVLSKFSAAEWKEMTGAAGRAADAARLILQDKTDQAMNLYNVRHNPEKERK